MDCSRLTLEAAIAQHQGDCWAGQVCHNKRSYYKNRIKRQKSKRSQYLAKVEGRSSEVQPESVVRSLEPEVLAIAPPAIPSAILITYADKLAASRQADVVVHAIAAELWVGQAKILELEPVHTFGWSPGDIKKYLDQVLSQFQQHYQANYGNQSKQGFQRFAQHVQRHSNQCPIDNCPTW